MERKRRANTMSATILGIILLVVSVYVVAQIGISIGDRFTTSNALAINATLNPEGAAAQTAINNAFYDNIQFTDILVFIAVAAGALWVLKAFGILG